MHVFIYFPFFRQLICIWVILIILSFLLYTYTLLLHISFIVSCICFLPDILPAQTGNAINRVDILTYNIDILMY